MNNRGSGVIETLVVLPLVILAFSICLSALYFWYSLSIFEYLFGKTYYCLAIHKNPTLCQMKFTKDSKRFLPFGKLVIHKMFASTLPYKGQTYKVVYEFSYLGKTTKKTLEWSQVSQNRKNQRGL